MILKQALPRRLSIGPLVFDHRRLDTCFRSEAIIAMLSKADILSRREEIIAMAARYGAADLRIFGSIARGDATETSDVDFLVRFEPGRSLFDQGGLLMDLRQLLGVNVDVVSEGALTGRFGQIVRREAVPL
jgi:uncharacterized protein